MLTIGCVNQKGGTGKSTIARLVAVAYARSGWNVKIADLDTKQKTSTDWLAQRLTANVQPAVAAEPFGSVKALRLNGYDLAVIDGKPSASVETLEIANLSDLILIPTNVTLDDLRPSVILAHELIVKGVEKKRILFLLNKTLDSAVMNMDAVSYIAEAGYKVAKTVLPSRRGYQMAQNTGRAVCETAFGSLNDIALELAQEVIDRLEALTKKEK